MALTTVAKVKAELSKSSTEHDTLIGEHVEAVSVWLAGYCSRDLEREVDRVGYLSEGGTSLRLPLYPVEAVAEIKQSTTRDFDNVDPLVEGQDYIITGGLNARNRGWIERCWGKFYSGPDVVRVTYTGGYWTGAEGGEPAGAYLLPEDVRHAATRMAVHTYRNRERFGQRSISQGSMEVSEVRDGLLMIARQMLAAHCNVVF